MTALLADGRSESPLESLSRLHILRLRLPTPELQVVLASEMGEFIGRSDFYWDEYGVIGEADGAAKYGDSSELPKERTRHGNLEEAGLVVVRWGWSDLRSFDVVARRLTAAFARGHRQGSPRRRWVCIRESA
jgi:hypothetical protein